MVNNIPVNGWPQLKDLEAVQPILNRLDKIEAWKRTVKEETFTGDDITIENALALPARSLITSINAIQDLHGYDNPWAGGAYKNKLPMTVASIKAANTDGTWTGNTYAINNGTVEILVDNDSNIIGYKVNGTFNVATTFKVGVPTGGNILNGCPSGGSWESYLMYQSNGAVDTGNGGSGVITTANVVISVASGYNASNLIFRPMTRATDASADFAPWENKCPISGRTEARVDDSNNLFDEVYDNLDTTVHYKPIQVGNGSFTMSTEAEGGSSFALLFFLAGNVSSGASSANNGVYSGQSRTVTAVNGYVTVAYRKGDIETQTPVGKLTTVVRSDETYNTSSATIQLGTTVYGADINWDTGVMTVKTTKVDMSSLEYRYASDSGHERMLSTTALSNVEVVPSGSVAEVKCSMFKPDSYDNVYQHTSDGIIAITPQGLIGVYSTTMGTDATAFKAAVTGQDIEYELATPQTIQLTPTQLQMLKGYNRLTLVNDHGTIEIKALTGANWS